MKGNFQIIVIVVFIALAIFGVLVFSGAIPIGKGDEPGGQGTVVLWGTVGNEAIGTLIQDFNNANPSFVVKYEQKDEEDFDQDLLEALAEGKGPDMVLLPDNLAFKYSNKILAIPYNSYPASAFKNTFAGAGEVFLTSRGVLAIPLTIDPLVMYYNRSMLDSSGVVNPPAFWEDFQTFVPAVSKKDESGKILKSAVALGHFSNITHAKDIISALFMQAGNPIVAEKDGNFSSALNNPSPKYRLGDILEFYTDFADPNTQVYSWNKSFLDSSETFSREDLVTYFGFASELKSLVDKNPNQNIGAAPFPQIRGSGFKLTGARVLGLAILYTSKNFTTAFTVANLMASGDFALKFAEATGTVPARRDLIRMKPTDFYSPTFYDSALYARSWLDPSTKDTDNIFRGMVEEVLSNTKTPSEAITDASNKLDLMLIRK